MTDRTFTFTIEQIKEIYRAGIRRGQHEESAHDWGCPTSGGTYGECVEAMHDIVNKGIKWGEDGYTDYSVVEEWFN